MPDAVQQPPDPSRERLAAALAVAAEALAEMVTRALAQPEPGLTPGQFRALVLLVTRGPQRIVDVSADLGVVSSSGTRLSERLVRRGLVARGPSGTDRRAVRLTLTPAGRRLVEQVLDRRRADLDRVVAAVPQALHAPLADALAALARAAAPPPDDPPSPSGVPGDMPQSSDVPGELRHP